MPTFKHLIRLLIVNTTATTRFITTNIRNKAVHLSLRLLLISLYCVSQARDVPQFMPYFSYLYSVSTNIKTPAH